ncbi:autophagy-related protein 5 [Marchantia polymorpha subsp. ruderalis]
MGNEDEDGKTGEEDFAVRAFEARKHVWMGAIPLLVHLHESEVTSLPAPTPLLILAPRNGYLPLLADSIKPHFQSTLPPGSDTIWFDYEGLPLKWHIPTGVLFDLLCAEPERPWNLTVHFRAYPFDLLSPCEGEDSVKWNFVNALKEASYVMFGSTKSVMNLSQTEQSDLWKSVVKGDLESYDHIFSRSKPGMNLNSNAPWNTGRSASHRPSSADSELENKRTRAGEGVRPGRLPMRFYIRSVKEKFDDFCDSSPVDSWDQLVYMTRPIDVPKDKETVLTLRDALMKVVPHLFSSKSPIVNNESDESRRSPESSAESDPAKLGEVSDQDTGNEKLEPEVGDIVVVAPLPCGADETGDSHEALEEESRMNAQDPCGNLYEFGDEDKLLSTTGGLWEGLKVQSAKQFEGVVRIQGIELNLDIPLDWVARNLCGPEMFIHLCICTWVSR